MFIKCTPNTLNAGNKIGMAKNAFSNGFKFISGKGMIESLFILWLIIANIINAMLSEIARKIGDNGVWYPSLSEVLFINNPKNIRKDMLSPTDSTNCAVISISFNFRICRINNPGRIVRTMNQDISLTKAIFNKIAMSAIRTIAIINTNIVLNFIVCIRDIFFVV